MKKVSSSASYSEFRKKNPNVKDPGIKDIGISELDQLAKQLEALNPIKKINSHKYDHPNGIIQQEEQDDTCLIVPANKAKPQAVATKKLKVLTTKLEPNSIKFDGNKLNKSIQSPGLSKKDKQITSAKEVTLKNSTKLPKRQQKDPKLTRRMSLTTIGKSSFISTNESLNTSVSQSENPISMGKKKQIIDKLAQIEAKIAMKSIPAHFYDQIIEKVEKIEQILEDC